MPVPSPFPTPALYGPMWTKFIAEEPEYLVTVGTPFKNGHVDYWLNSDTPIYRFVFEYATLTETEAAILDDHYASAKGRAFGFLFTDPRTQVNYTGVHYEKFEKSHDKSRKIQKRVLTLVKRP